MISHLDISKYTENGNLLGSEQGEQILEGIQGELNKLLVGDILLLDFQNIRHATPDSLIGIVSAVNQLKGREFQDKYIILKLNRENVGLESTFTLILKEDGIVVPSLDEEDNWTVLGALTKAQRETLEIIGKRGEMTSTEASEQLNIPIRGGSRNCEKNNDLPF